MGEIRYESLSKFFNILFARLIQLLFCTCVTHTNEKCELAERLLILVFAIHPGPQPERETEPPWRKIRPQPYRKSVTNTCIMYIFVLVLYVCKLGENW